MQRFIFALGLSLAGSAAHAQLAEFLPTEDPFRERLEEHGRVSGDIYMGVMIGPAAPDSRPDAAGMRTANVVARNLPLDREGAPSFCVRINSKDGRLEAANTYVAGASAGTFSYTGRYGDDLAAMSAVSLVRVGRCGDRSDVVVPSAWERLPDASGAQGALARQDTAKAAGEQALHIFVNAAGNPAVMVVGADPDVVPCTDVAEPSTLKYTAVCILRFDRIAPHVVDGEVALALFVARSLGEDRHDIRVILPDVDGGDP